METGKSKQRSSRIVVGFIALGLAVIFALALSGCDGSEANSTPAPTLSADQLPTAFPVSNPYCPEMPKVVEHFSTVLRQSGEEVVGVLIDMPDSCLFLSDYYCFVSDGSYSGGISCTTITLPTSTLLE